MTLLPLPLHLHRFSGTVSLTLSDADLRCTSSSRTDALTAAASIAAAKQLYMVTWRDALASCAALQSLTVATTTDISSTLLVPGIAANLYALRYLDLQLKSAPFMPFGSYQRAQNFVVQVLVHCSLLQSLRVTGVRLHFDEFCRAGSRARALERLHVDGLSSREGAAMVDCYEQLLQVSSSSVRVYASLCGIVVVYTRGVSCMRHSSYTASAAAIWHSHSA
jgi:hypothetical protein